MSQTRTTARSREINHCGHLLNAMSGLNSRCFVKWNCVSPSKDVERAASGNPRINPAVHHIDGEIEEYE